MQTNNLMVSFLRFCEENKYEKNKNQIKVIEQLAEFSKKKNFLRLFFKSNQKLCFYLFGGVGVGKTMIINHFYKNIDLPKYKIHFNEFMINFHDYRHQNKKNSIKDFVLNLKKKIQVNLFR